MFARAAVGRVISVVSLLAAISLQTPLARAQSGPDRSGTPPPGSAAANASAAMTLGGLADGGTIRANRVVVPPSMKAKRAPKPEEPIPLIALAPPDVLEALGEFKPEIGAWAEYSISEHKQPTAHVLLSVLPPPMPDGSYWLEVDVVTDQSMPAAMRILAKGNPARPSAVERVVVYIAGQQAVEFPTRLAKSELKALPEPARSGANIKTTHGVAIQVKAGSYNTDRIKIVLGKEATTIWRSSAVPLFGLVKSEGAGRTTELVASGLTGAHTLISTPIQNEAIPPSVEDAEGAPEPDQGNGSDNK